MKFYFKKNKRFLILILIFISIYVYYKYEFLHDYLMKEFFAYKNLDVSINGNNNINNFLISKWLMNGIVSQYSSIMVLKLDKKLIIETLSFINFFNKKDKNNLNNIKCFIKIDDKIIIKSHDEVLSIALMGTKFGADNILRIRCILETHEHLNKFNQIFIAIVDYPSYLNLLNSDYKNIMFQRPKFFDESIKKKKGIINCVHTIYNIDDFKFKKLNTWIKIQKKIGYHKLRLYFHQVSDHLITELKDNYKNFIDVINYKTDLAYLCDWYSKKLDNNTQAEFYSLLYKNCANLTATFFEMTDDMVKNSHERMCSNDCLLQSKHEYEYVSNYDFDEVIFPRKFKSNHVIDFKIPSNNIPPKEEYNIYSYIRSLVQKYGKNVAYFQFDNVLFFKDFKTIFKKILNTNESLLKNNDLIEYNHEKMNIKYFININNDLNYLKSFKKVKNYICFLNETINNNTNINFNFNNYFATLVNNREGKSIYNTDFTESYNQHFAWTIKKNTIKIKIPLDVGFVSHFRDHDLYIDIKYPLSYTFLDIEYYNFLYYLSKDF